MDKKIKEIAKKENKKSVVKLNKKKSEDISLTQILKDNFKKFNKNSFRTAEVIFLVVVTSIISLIVGYLLNDEGTNKSKSNDKYINEIIDNYNNIVNNYYEGVDKSKLVSGAVNGMVESLGDEHSSLIDQTNDSTFNINLKGTYEGIGVEIINDDDMNIVVIGVISDSPAAKAGIKAGDIIKKIDDKSLENTNITELTKYVKENKNELYNLIIVRDKNEMNVTIERSKITIKSVLSKTFERNNKKIGYIYMSVFANATVDQFEKALAQLEKENIDGLIIDVRSNTGGHLTTAVSIVSNFLDDTNVIYQIEQNNKKTKHYSIGDKTKEYPIVVLQNNGSASASELLSSSLKEAYGATIIGTTSYGKGTVQEMVKLKNGDSYKFTTKKWLTPKGNSINKKGVKPDVEIELSDEYINNPSDDTDNQLQEAINYLTK